MSDLSMGEVVIHDAPGDNDYHLTVRWHDESKEMVLEQIDMVSGGDDDDVVILSFDEFRSIVQAVRARGVEI